MSDKVGIICTPEEVSAARIDAQALNVAIREEGMTFARPAEVGRAVQWQQMALVSEAVITALDYFIAQGGGSRGARAICDPAGEALPMARSGPLDAYRFRTEKPEHQAEQIIVRFEDGSFEISTRPNRPFDEEARSFFERDWPDWLTGGIYSERAQKPAR